MQSVILGAKQYIPSIAIGIKYPKVSIHIWDDFKFVKEYKDSFNVIITDSSN